MLNILVALAWGGIGLVGASMGALSVHGTDVLIPLILVGAGALVGLSGILLLIPTPDGRPRRSEILILGLAVVVALGNFLFADAVEFGNFRNPDPGTVLVMIIPAIITLCLVVELIFLWRVRASTRPA